MASTDADYDFVISTDWHSCQQINSAYQEVYAFETASFYINICEQDGVYFYSGEAKQSEHSEDLAALRSSIFIPATPLDNRDGFQAENGNVSYIVILPFADQNDLQSSPSDRAEAILTIRRNDRLVSVESSLNKYCYRSDAIALDNLKLNPHSDRLATIPQQHDNGWHISSDELEILPMANFDSDSRFDFYRLGSKLHRLTTCN